MRQFRPDYRLSGSTKTSVMSGWATIRPELGKLPTSRLNERIALKATVEPRVTCPEVGYPDKWLNEAEIP
jgi:hypothetical protein